jgi:DNA-binding HxlR family transcriptional regulator
MDANLRRHDDHCAYKALFTQAGMTRLDIRNCSVDRTLSILSDAWSFLVLREMYLGARRFDEIQTVLGLPRSTLSERLARLAAGNVICRRQYQDAPPRFEYRLTESGQDLYLVMLSMLRFGDDWLADEGKPPLQLVHAACGHACRPLSVCSSCHQPVRAVDVTYRDGPGAGTSPVADRPQRRRFADEDQYERGRPSSVSRTLRILGDRWSFLVLREAFFGVTRFDPLQDRLAIAPNILADRLARLVTQQILHRRKYQEQPDRFDYHLTEMGRALYLPMIEMMRWGDRWISTQKPLIVTHRDCGQDFESLIVCDHCHAPLKAQEMRYRLNYTPRSLALPKPAALLTSDR